jgi:FAD/FMN-containing dehydrogenase
MSEPDLKSSAAKIADVDESAIKQFRSSFGGNLLRASDAGYDEARTIWNAMIDKKPGMIAVCRSSKDVKQSVDFAREHQLLTAIHGCGHNIAGNAICDDGLVIDLSQMKSVKVNPSTSTAEVEPGVTLGEFDAEAQKHGLATPVGINSTTGIAGLTLGGGFGWLSRKRGLTADCLRGAEIVTADGKIRHVSDSEDSDLFWAIRGGGGNFGIVTRFEFELFPVGPEVLSGLVVFPEKEIRKVLRRYRDYAADLSDDTTVFAILRQAPPLPFLPEAAHGSNIIALAFCHFGDAKEGEKALQGLRGLGEVLGEHTGVQPYVDWQRAFDPLLTPGARNYWKSHNLKELSDGLLDLAIEAAANVPNPQCEIFFAQLGGATNRVSEGATAYPHRDADFLTNVHSRWDNASDDRKCIDWARDFFQRSVPYATGGVYINFMTADETDRVKSGYGSSYDRLIKVKQKYDPTNLFRMNQNISPNGSKS